MMASPLRLRSRAAGEQGTALIVALMSMMLMTALGVAVVMVSNTESLISANYRNNQEALYAADAVAERIVQDLLLVPRWNDILGGTTQSSFTDGDPAVAKTIPGGGTVRLDLATAQLQASTDNIGAWGANNPTWRLYAWGPLSNLLPDDVIDSPMYVALWVADDPHEEDGDAASDVNGVLMLHAEAYGPSGSRRIVEVTVGRTNSTEIERGQIAQRGQEELNQRARKSAVQTPGGTLTRMRMTVSGGGLAVQ